MDGKLAEKVLRSEVTIAGIDELSSPTGIVLSAEHVAALTSANIDHHLIEAFFESMRSDLSENKHTQKSLDSYVYGSAEVVGLMCLKVFVNGDQKYYDNLIFCSKLAFISFFSSLSTLNRC